MDPRLKLEVVDGVLHMTNTTATKLAVGIGVGPPGSNRMDGLGLPIVLKPGETKAMSFLLPPS